MLERYEPPVNKKGLSEYNIHTEVNIVVSMQKRRPTINSDGLVANDLIRIVEEMAREWKARRDLADWMSL